MTMAKIIIDLNASDPRSNDELISALLALPDDSEETNQIYTILQARRNPEIIRRAQEMCSSTYWSERRIGAGILSQNGAGNYKILDTECVDTLLYLLQNDNDPDVLETVCYSLVNYKDLRISAYLTRIMNHYNDNIRYAVVRALLGREDNTSIGILIELSADPDDDVRNWATFGLAQQIDNNTLEIQEALSRRVDDECDEIRAEALLGLARRDYEQMVNLLIRELKYISKNDNYWDMVFEAAAETGDSRLYPELMAMRDQDIDNKYFERAIVSCRIPKPGETCDQPDYAKTTCPVCGLRNAFADPKQDFCIRCGWAEDFEQLEDPDLTRGWNYRSLNQARERWKDRVIKSRGQCD